MDFHEWVFQQKFRLLAGGIYQLRVNSLKVSDQWNRRNEHDT